MLPFVARNRKVSSTSISGDITADAGRMISTLRKTSFNLRHLAFKTKCLLVIFCLLCVYLYGSVYFLWGENSLKKEDFLEVDKCPACYGRSKCFELFDDNYELSGLSKYRTFDMVNIRNVHFATHKRNGHRIVLKKLAHYSEIKTVDDEICKDSFRKPGCDLARTYVVTKTAQDIAKNGLLPEHLKDTTFMFMCPTHRLLDRILEKYQEKFRPDGPFITDDYLQILYTAMVNPEPLILQTFPASEGWPFPSYLGACGRYVAIEHMGRPLGDFYNAPWHVRADLSYQVLVMAQKMTNDPDWSLYWTDIAYDNYAVDDAMKLSVIDLENIIVVDKNAVKTAKKKGWDELAEAPFDDCIGHDPNCLTFDSEILCTHYEADHNYYSVCRNLLSQYADVPSAGMMDGLLHDMPSYAKDDWDLENLLNECARPTQPKGRIKTIYSLIEALKNLRNVKLSLDVKGGRRIA